ncbi:sigma-70 family RNA polymerase sigma factor [Limibaculum sp. M0105]|uniref:Sigma-70 family RNA polymerase sigma factor n=1 Tax=Thermohalobaculum xanthum TaxID=2753746 RepID=A0A8J7M8E7_9RHOB|nr:sigma-70 family RNA polymerase sigma factor [Thermohalobaculum xanthum]
MEFVDGRGPLRKPRAIAALRPDLVAYAVSLTGDVTRAEDVVHDAIVRALQARNVPRRSAELRPWAFRVVRNLVIDRYRKNLVRAEYSREQGRLFDEGQATAGDPIEALIVRQAFERLPRRDREILCLIDILGFSYAEAAGTIGIPVGTVMSRVSRARRAMMTLMEGSNVRPLRQRK